MIRLDFLPPCSELEPDSARTNSSLVLCLSRWISLEALGLNGLPDLTSLLQEIKSAWTSPSRTTQVV